jgi:CheY-like chemotaxis protein
MGKLRHILLVEDDHITNFINKRLIQKMIPDSQVSIAYNGFEGLSFLNETLKNHKSIPQLILLDINMPVMDGFEFLEKFQKLQLSEKVSIVMLTTSNHLKDLDKLFKTGNSDIIAKPLTEDKLRTLISRYFEEDTEYSQIA